MHQSTVSVCYVTSESPPSYTSSDIASQLEEKETEGEETSL